MSAEKSRRLLFVCTGNIGRSPVAQFLAEKLARERGLPWRAESAGTAAEVGEGMEAGAVKALASRGLAGLTHRARQVDERMLAAADKVYALTRGHRDRLAAGFPEFSSKVEVLREAAGLPGPDVDDPYGQSDAVYEQCAARIEEALDILIRRNHAEPHR